MERKNLVQFLAILLLTLVTVLAISYIIVSRTKREFVMRNEKSLLELVDQFYKKDFSFDSGYKLFGPKKEEKGWRISIYPSRSSNLEEIILEKETETSNFLSGISLQFKSPIKIDFSKMKNLFGQEKEIPGLRPEAPWTYQFIIKGKELDGLLLLTIPQPKRAETFLSVQSVILRRFAPLSPQGKEWQELLDKKAEYGTKVKYAKSQKILFPDFVLEFKGERIQHSDKINRSFVFWDFSARDKKNEASFSWTKSGTGGMGPASFELSGQKYKVELFGFPSQFGRLEEDELVIRRD